MTAGVVPMAIGGTLALLAAAHGSLAIAGLGWLASVAGGYTARHTSRPRLPKLPTDAPGTATALLGAPVHLLRELDGQARAAAAVPWLALAAAIAWGLVRG
jgi:hypothetical protein